MKVKVIVAIDDNNCIGKDNELLYSNSEDMEHFKNLTIGNVVIMGRKTYFSIPEKFRPLRNRLNIVMCRSVSKTTRELEFEANQKNSNLSLSTDPNVALELAHKYFETERITNGVAYIIGGSEIYKLFMDNAQVIDELIVSHFPATKIGNKFFPTIDKNIFDLSKIEDRNGFSIITYSNKFK